MDPQAERSKNRKSDVETRLHDNKNMLILNNNIEYDVPKNNYGSGSLNNYISPKPKLELMTDKFFGTKTNNKTNFNASDPTGNSRSNVNNYIFLTSKLGKHKIIGKSDDISSGFDSYKLKLSLSNNVLGIKYL